MRSMVVAVFPLLLAAQLVETKSCSGRGGAAPVPATTPTPAPSASEETYTTQDGVRFRAEVLLTNLEIPWSLAFAPDGRLFVTERPGRVRIVDVARRSSEVALTLDDAFTAGEAGVLGVAVDPAFADNHRVYVYYAARIGAGAVNRVVRYREAGGTLGERVVLLDNIPAATIHDAGRVRFGPDGLLYVTTGDAANERLPQDAASLGGKILRLNTDGTTPRSNPFSSPMFSLGHRNPQGLDWHPVTGSLWASEHGSSGNDEINVIEAGGNYGWPLIEASATAPGLRTPVTFYNPAVAPSGASFYRGSRFPQFENNLFVGTLRGLHLLRLRLDPASPGRIAAQERLLEGKFGRIRDVVPGPDGYLYFCTSNRDGRFDPVAADDRLVRLVPAT